jgi:hypothetical protein
MSVGVTGMSMPRSVGGVGLLVLALFVSESLQPMAVVMAISAQARSRAFDIWTSFEVEWRDGWLGALSCALGLIAVVRESS